MKSIFSIQQPEMISLNVRFGNQTKTIQIKKETPTKSFLIKSIKSTQEKSTESSVKK